MAWMKVETSVSRNRKFVKAGPGPSWLWICGLAYCQEGLTDGFIPQEALPYLGVKSAPNLVKHLVSSGLWDVVDGGWQVHDYLEHNKSANQIADEKHRRGDGGKLGGRPKQNLPENLEGKPSVKPSHKPSLSVAVGGAAAAADLSVGGVGEFPGDVWWLELLASYPKNRVTNNHLANQAFIGALLRADGGPRAAWDRMKFNLENQKRGHEWRVRGMVPSLQKWLESGAWEQQHDEHPPAVLVNDRTAATMSAAAAVRARGGR
jgi:hypothetical protein